MPVTLSGNAGQTGSLVLTDSDTNNVLSLSLAGSLSATATPNPIPSSPSASDLQQMYANTAYRNTLTLTTTYTAVAWSSLTNALCQGQACAKVNVIYIKNQGANAIHVSWSSKLNSGAANDTGAHVIIPAYGVFMWSVPMDGVAVTGTDALLLKSAATTTSAYVVIAYK